MTSSRTSLNAASVKAELYARVSTDDGRQTVGNQVRQLCELAVSRDFEIFANIRMKKRAPAQTGPHSSHCCGMRD
jgi:predicted site-specific integrase-resolvase